MKHLEKIERHFGDYRKAPFLSFLSHISHKMNPATFILYKYTCWQYDMMSFGYDDSVAPKDIGIRDFWLDMMEDFSDEYENEWFALVATPNIEKTIDWNAITNTYCIKRMIATHFEDN